jgi:hypothetical protein
VCSIACYPITELWLSQHSQCLGFWVFFNRGMPEPLCA